MVLSYDQLAHPEETEREIINRKLIINTAIDVQVILQLLIEKEIITREDVQRMRATVSVNDSRYSNAKKWIDQAEAELARAKADPQWVIRAMMDEKLKGK